MRTFLSTLVLLSIVPLSAFAQYTASTVSTLVRCNDYQSVKDQSCTEGVAATSSCGQATDMINQYCSSVLGTDGRVSNDKIQEVIAQTGGGASPPTSAYTDKKLFEECQIKQQYLIRECSKATSWTETNNSCSTYYNAFNNQCSNYPALAFTPPTATGPGTAADKHVFEECQTKQQFLIRECSKAAEWADANGTCSTHYSAFKNQCANYPALAFTPPSIGGGVGTTPPVNPGPTQTGDNPQLGECRSEYTNYLLECSTPVGGYSLTMVEHCKNLRVGYEKACSQATSVIPVDLPVEQGGPSGISPTADAKVSQECEAAINNMVRTCNNSVVSKDCELASLRKRQVCDGAKITIPPHATEFHAAPPEVDTKLYEACKKQYAAYADRCNEKALSAAAQNDTNSATCGAMYKKLVDLGGQTPGTDASESYQKLLSTYDNLCGGTMEQTGGANPLARECTQLNQDYMNKCGSLYGGASSSGAVYTAPALNPAPVPAVPQVDTSAALRNTTEVPAQIPGVRGGIVEPRIISSVTTTQTPVLEINEGPVIPAPKGVSISETYNPALFGLRYAYAEADLGGSVALTDPGAKADEPVNTSTAAVVAPSSGPVALTDSSYMRTVEAGTPTWQAQPNVSRIYTVSPDGNTENTKGGSQNMTFIAQEAGAVAPLTTVQITDREGVYWRDPITGESWNGLALNAPPSNYAISTPINQTNGFTTLISSTGTATPPRDGGLGMDLQVTYVTDRPNSDGNNEYGFYRDRASSDPSAINFYYSIDTNIYGNAFRDKDNNSRPINQTTSPVTTFSNVKNYEGSSDGQFYTTSYIVRSDTSPSGYAFKVAVVDGNHTDRYATATINGVERPAVVEIPIENWFPAEEMMNKQVYVVTGSQTVGSPTYTNDQPTTFNVGGVWTGASAETAALK